MMELLLWNMYTYINLPAIHILVVKPACHIAKLFFPCVIFGDQKSAGHSGRAQYAHLAS